MVWNATWPDGSKSVKANETPGQQNTTYIETTMGNTANDTTNTNVIRDHYWNVGVNLDGRHRFVNMPAFTIAGSATDPVVGTGMGGVVYVREDKTTGTDNEVYFRNASGTKKLSNPVEIVACGYITDITGTPTLSNSYNVASFTNVAVGQWKITFSSNLADTNYIVTGAIGDSDGRSWIVPSATKLGIFLNFIKIVRTQMDTFLTARNVTISKLKNMNKQKLENLLDIDIIISQHLNRIDISTKSVAKAVKDPDSIIIKPKNNIKHIVL